MSSYCLNREIHPEGLPQAYTIILLFRLLPESPNEPFAIWQITDRDYKPQVGVVLDRKDDYAYCIENLYVTLLCMHSSQIFPNPKHSYMVKGLYLFSFKRFFFTLYSNYLFQLRIIQLSYVSTLVLPLKPNENTSMYLWVSKTIYNLCLPN